MQNNVRNFDFWLQTIDGRIIGGDAGLRPFFVNADFPFLEGANDRENMVVTLDAWFNNLPAMTSTPVDVSEGGSGGGGFGCDCNINTLLNSLPSFINDDDAASGGLTSGMAYWVLPGNDIQPAGTIRRIP